MKRRTVTTALPLLLATSALRAQGTAPVEGTHFSVLKQPVRSGPAGKIEVLEFFSYGCPACNAFDPSVERWTHSLAADVAFRRVPVPFLYNSENFQRTFYALEMTGALTQCHSKIFDAVHLEKRRLAKPEEIAELVAKTGADPTKFLAAFKSFSMTSQLAKAKSATSSCQVDQIPTLAIGGRYTTSPGQAGGVSQAIAVANFLIERCRRA